MIKKQCVIHPASRTGELSLVSWLTLLGELERHSISLAIQPTGIKLFFDVLYTSLPRWSKTKKTHENAMFQPVTLLCVILI